MKLYLDDTRPAPEGWIRMENAFDAIIVLNTRMITHLSLDHDLGDEKENGTGYDVLLFIEEEVVMSDFVPPEIEIHTSNPAARRRMLLAVENIRRIYNERNNKAE